MSRDRATYRRGLVEVADGVFAYLQPDGGWGWSNAGLVVGSGGSLLVDTLFDVPLTEVMLREMEPHTRRAPISTVVNTHANGDHCYGNQLLAGARIIASDAAVAEMELVPASMLSSLLEAAPNLGTVGDYLVRIFGPFDFASVTPTAPTESFTGQLQLEVGGRVVELVELGPAHTAGDVIAWLPDERVLFTGDLLFVDGTPLAWEGPVANWVRACDRLVALDPAVVVPGHGPVTDVRGIRRVRNYLEWLVSEVEPRWSAGMSAADAARDIDPGAYGAWRDSERLAVNVDTVYRDLDPTRPRTDIVTLFALMAELHHRRSRT